jgi:hypothetical protein
LAAWPKQRRRKNALRLYTGRTRQLFHLLDRGDSTEIRLDLFSILKEQQSLGCG